MASFEERSVLDIIQVFRPQKSDAKAWWRYAILAERYKVRCMQREELWRQAGIKNMSLLAHIRAMIEKHGGFDGVSLDNVSENYLEDTCQRLHTLESVVEDLNRENIVLRKMLKTLLTPLAKEGFVAEELSLEDIENEIAVFDDFTSKTSLESPTSARTYNSSPLRLEVNVEEELKDQLIASLADSVDSPTLNLRSPYEMILPPIELTDRDMQEAPKASRPTRFTTKKSPQLKPPQDKFLSYVEQEALRKEKAAERKKQQIMRRADELLRTSALDNDRNPSMYLPIFKVMPTDVLVPSSSGAGNSDLAEELDTRSLRDLDQKSQASSGKTGVSKAAIKPVAKQPVWVDDCRIVDISIGRGRGKPREPPEPTEASKLSRKNRQQQINGSEKNSPPKKSPPRNKIYPETSPDMSDAEKMTVGFISKARSKKNRNEELKRPLTNLEMNLLKSPLALPVMKAPPNSVPMISPREKALRSKVSPRVQSFIHPQRASPTPHPPPSSTVDTSYDVDAEAPVSQKNTQPPVFEAIEDECFLQEERKETDIQTNAPTEDSDITQPTFGTDTITVPTEEKFISIAADTRSNEPKKLPRTTASPRQPSVSPVRISPRLYPGIGAASEQNSTPRRDKDNTPVGGRSLSPRGKKDNLSPSPSPSHGSSSQRSPLRSTSPRDNGNGSPNDHPGANIVKRKANKGDHHDEPLTLTSQSAPSTVMTAKPSAATAHDFDESLSTNLTASSALDSPGKHRSESEKMRKKNVLKSLNEKSNPNSPRNEKLSPTGGEPQAAVDAHSPIQLYQQFDEEGNVGECETNE